MLPGQPFVHVAYGDDGKEGVPKDVGCQLYAAALPRAGSRNLCLLWLHALCRNGSNPMLREEGGEREERSCTFPNMIMCLVHVELELLGHPPLGLQFGCVTVGRGPWGPSLSKRLAGYFNWPGWNFSTKA